MGDYDIKGVRMQKQFERVCKAMGWDCNGDAWLPRTNGSNLSARVGHTFIQRGANPLKAYYRVVRMVSCSGGEQALSDTYTARELSAFFDGLLLAHDTLAPLHANLIRSVDSGRGNEGFAAAAIERSLQ